MAIQIIVDSASDVEVDYALQHGITVIPMKNIFGGVEYREGVDITREEFYEKLVESSEIPSTSMIPPLEFKEAFDRVLAVGDSVLAITLSGKLSGTYESACMAARACEGEVRVIDSESVTIAERLLVERAVALRDQGVALDDIAAQLEREKKEICVIAALDTLEYLKKGGRVSSVAAFAGGLLSIKPVISLVEGEVEVIGKVRGSKQSNNFLRERILESGIDFSRPLRLGYTGLSDALLRKYVKDSRDLFEGHLEGDPEVSLIGSTIGTHAGPGALAVAFFRSN